MMGTVFGGWLKPEEEEEEENKLAKLGDAIAISKSETINHSPTD